MHLHGVFFGSLQELILTTLAPEARKCSKSIPWGYYLWGLFECDFLGNLTARLWGPISPWGLLPNAMCGLSVSPIRLIEYCVFTQITIYTGTHNPLHVTTYA